MDGLDVAVFPARAGMSRFLGRPLCFPYSVPRASGDEPGGTPYLSFTVAVFPARAGMSRFLGRPLCFPYSVPRASGDEPTDSPYREHISECSPRERG